MNEQEAKLLEELRREPMYELYDDAELMAVAREIERELTDYEADMRPAGMHWPENLIASSLGLGWAELKESVDGASVEKVLSDLLNSLTERECKIVKLFYKEEKSLFEIAEEFDVSYATIRSILAQGTGKLCRPSRARSLAACVEKSDREPVFRRTNRTSERLSDDEESADEENNENAEDDADDIFKDIPDDTDDKSDEEDEE